MTEATDFEVLLSIYSDLHKDAFGMRPRGELERVSQLTEDELRAEMARLENIVVQDMDYERGTEAEDINYMLSIGAPDEDTAKRWLQEAA